MRRLPSDPSLEQLKNQATDLLRSFRSGDASVFDRLRHSLPEMADLADEQIQQSRFALKDAQRSIAREYGFDDWTALKRQLEAMSRPIESEELRALLQAIDATGADAVERILHAHPHLGATRQFPDKGWSLLFRAGADVFLEETDAHLRIVELLLANGADVDDGGTNEQPLANNAYMGNLGTVRLLLAHGADPNYPAFGDETIVACTARHDHKLNNGQIVAALIDAGARHNLGDLVQAGLEERVVELLEADPSALDRPVPLRKAEVGPPLHAGLHTDFFHHADDREARMMNLLLDRGADIDAVDSQGLTALQRAAEHEGSRHTSIADKARSIAQLLLQRGARVDLFAATALGDVDRVRELIGQDPGQVHARRADGKTPLHVAHEVGRAQVAELLVAQGADPHARSESGSTPVDAEVDHLGGQLQRHAENCTDPRGSVELSDRYWALTSDAVRADAERARLCFLSARAKLTTGDVPGALGHAETLVALAEKEGEHLRAANLVNAGVRLCQGEWAAARVGFDYCVANPLGEWGQWWFHGLYALLESEAGNVEASERHLAACRAHAQPEDGSTDILHPSKQSLLAFFAAWSGRILGREDGWEDAERLARKALDPLHSDCPCHAVRARVALGVIAIGRDDRSSAEEQYRELQPYKGIMVLGEPPAIDRVLGLLAQALGRLDDAVSHFEEAMGFSRRGLDPERAHAATECAEVLQQRQASGDRERAAALLGEAATLADSKGMGPLKLRGQRLLRRQA